LNIDSSTLSKIDIVMPARNEAPTIAANVLAAASCRYVRNVIVVDDGSTDDTAARAERAGADLVIRREEGGSKAHAMQAGVEATDDADAIFFVDADCTGLTSTHLDEIARPFVEGRAVMSLGAFDYGRFWNPMVLRWPPLTGERIIPRWVWDAIPPDKLDGYTIEVRINEVIAERRLETVARTMTGVYHRTKRDKLGRLAGAKATVDMYRDLLGLLLGKVRWRTYWFYLRGLTVDR
jgi:glycosyltransferase involved in cell wall biosynthesis